MEQQPQPPNGGEHQRQPERPGGGSYGTDDPETQAYIENARIDAARQRQQDRARLQQLVEHGMSPDDAEAVIEFERAAEPLSGVTPDESRTTSIEDTRTDLADLLELRQQPGGAVALAEFAASLRQRAGSGASQMPSDPAAVATYQAIGLDRRDALAVAGFENYLRDKLKRVGDPAADLAPEHDDRAPRYQPRIYVIDSDSAERGITHGLWIDAAQSVGDLKADIAAMLDSSPTPDAKRWTVTDTDDFAGLELTGVNNSDLLATLGRGVADHAAAFAAWASVQGTNDRDLLERFDDFYVGSYQNERDWAESIAVDLGWLDQLDRVVEPSLRQYLSLDYDKIAREARSRWDVVIGIDGKTHVFMR